MENNNNQKKKISVGSIILMILGPLCLIAGIAFLVIGFGDFNNSKLYIVGMFMLPLGFILSSAGFIPLLHRGTMKMHEHVIERGSSTLTKMASTIQNSLKELNLDGNETPRKDRCSSCGAKVTEEDKYCPYCGSKID